MKRIPLSESPGCLKPNNERGRVIDLMGLVVSTDLVLFSFPPFSPIPLPPFSPILESLQSVHFGVAKGLGSLVGGAILKVTENDSIFLFAASSIFALVTAFIYTIYTLVYPVDPDAIAGN